MKLFLLLIITLASLQAQSFSKQMLLGKWEISSTKLNSFIAFGKYIGKQRNETITLFFNQKGFLKELTTGTIYNYEVLNGKLKIYETKIYKNNYKVKRKSRYDLFKIIGVVDGCLKIKVVKKKIPGYTSKYPLKMCKITNIPQPTYQESISTYNFKK
jgi:hypothetical protein